MNTISLVCSQRKSPGECANTPGAVTNTEHRDPVQVRRAYKFLLRPTPQQVAALEACLEDNRQLYNAALEERREAWRMGKHRITLYSQSRQIKDIRKADPDGQGRWAFTCQWGTIAHLDHVFRGFYRRCKAGQKAGYPRFRGFGRFNSLEWQVNSGCGWDSVPHPTVTRVYFKGVGHVRVHQHRPVGGRIKTITAKRDCDRWYVILSCEDVPAVPLSVIDSPVGIDMGIAHFLTTSDGAHVPNPRYLATAAPRITTASRSISRKERGSSHHRQAVRRVKVFHAKVRRQRLDHAHKVALSLVREHDLIIHEALTVANMSRRPAPRPLGGGAYERNGSAAKSAMNKLIRDAGWGIFLKILRDKAECAGREIIEVPSCHTSQRCAQCGHRAKGNRKREKFHCLACGHEAHADVNAAQNILRAGLALQVHAA